MTLRREQRDELYDLIELLFEEQLDEAGNDRLASLLTSSDEARWIYVSEMNLQAGLTWDCGMLSADEEDSGISGQWPVASGQWLDSEIHPSSFIPHPSSIPPIIVDPTPTVHSPIGSFLFSHMAAAVLLGIGLLLGLAWRISLPIPEKQNPSSTDFANIVARITALADCQGHKTGSGVRDQGSGISEIQIPKSLNPQIPVFLGDRFHISSGLMQITYDTGAQVLLQGPCTYEIDSDRTGYLAVGKLTALVEKGPGVRGPGSGNAKHSPLSTLHPPLFAVRTPTATVTDLGTEFGVEVEESGATHSHVFQGMIELRAGNSQRSSKILMEILHAGESARVERGRNREVAVTRELGQPGRFVRQISNPRSLAGATGSASAGSRAKPVSHNAYARYVISLKPVVYYRMERPKAKKDRLVVFDSASGRHHGVFRSKDTSVLPYATGRFGDAMVFRGADKGDYVFVPNYPQTNGDRLTVTAWIMAQSRQSWATIASDWRVAWNREHVLGQFHFGLSPGGELQAFITERGGRNAGIGEGDAPNASPLPLLRWQHVAFTIDGKTLRIYRNGEPLGSRQCAGVLSKPAGAALGIGGIAPWNNGDPATPQQAGAELCWQGRIDEVAIFNKILSPQTIQQLYRHGTSSAKGDGSMNDP